MGTTNRSYNRNLFKAQMSHSATIETRKFMRVATDATKNKKAEVLSFTSKVKLMAKNILHALTFGIFRKDKTPTWKNIKCPMYFHSQYGQGKRSAEDRAERKRRRQNRQKLIAHRGWA